MISGTATPGRFTATNAPLRFILLYAYHVRDTELLGVPAWVATTRHSVAATYPAGFVPGPDNVRAMVQTLLADRIHIAAHRETRELPVYALTLARKDGRLGPQLEPSDVDCEKWLAEGRPRIGAGGPSPVAPGGQRPACSMITAFRFISGGTTSIAELVSSIDSLVGRPVVDRTGLTGKFNIDVQWTPASNASPDAAPSDACRSSRRSKNSSA